MVKRGPIRKRTGKALRVNGKPSRSHSRLQRAAHLPTDAQPPTDFDDDHRDKWIELASGLSKQGLLSSADRDLLQRYVDAYIDERRARAVLAQQGEWVTCASGYVSQHADSLKSLWL